MRGLAHYHQSMVCKTQKLIGEQISRLNVCVKGFSKKLFSHIIV